MIPTGFWICVHSRILGVAYRESLKRLHWLSSIFFVDSESPQKTFVCRPTPTFSWFRECLVRSMPSTRMIDQSSINQIDRNCAHSIPHSSIDRIQSRFILKRSIQLKNYHQLQCMLGVQFDEHFNTQSKYQNAIYIASAR